MTSAWLLASSVHLYAVRWSAGLYHADTRPSATARMMDAPVVVSEKPETVAVAIVLPPVWSYSLIWVVETRITASYS